MKFEWTGYFKPTPPLMRKVGMGFKAVAGSNVPAVLTGHVNVAIALFIIGAVGSFMCNLFVDDSNQGDK